VRRLPLGAFVALAIATVAAVFITQHLKVTTPLIAGAVGPAPQAICPGSSTQITFHVLHAADDIDVYVVDAADRIVRTLATGLPDARKQDRQFTWNGRLDRGGPAPPGVYRFRVRLIHQRRTIDPLLNQTTQTPMAVRVRSSC
jgi:flagellar hook assembly protein FlgD